MDLVIENVGRRSSKWGGEGDPTDIGDASLNGRERNALYWNRGEAGFEEVGHLAHANRAEDGRGVAVADFDRDGRLDLAIQNLDKPAVLLMGRGEAGHWLQVSLETARGSRDAIGARAVAWVGGRRQLRQVISGSGFLSSSSRVLHFGLGEAERVDRLEIHWPSGARETLHDVEADQRIVVREGERRAAAPRRARGVRVAERHFRHAIHIRVAPEALHAFLADLHHYRDVHPLIVRIDDLPPRPGRPGARRYRVTDRLRLGPFRFRTAYVAELEGVSSDRIRGTAWQVPGIEVHTHYGIEPERGGSVLREVVRVKAPRPLVGTVWRRARAAHVDMLGNLKQLLEGGDRS